MCLNVLFSFPWYRCSRLWSNRWLGIDAVGHIWVLARLGSLGMRHSKEHFSHLIPGTTHTGNRIPLAAVLLSSKELRVAIPKDTVRKQQNWYSKPGLLTTKSFCSDCCEVESPQQIQSHTIKQLWKEDGISSVWKQLHLYSPKHGKRDTELTCKVLLGAKHTKPH